MDALLAYHSFLFTNSYEFYLFNLFLEIFLRLHLLPADKIAHNAARCSHTIAFDTAAICAHATAADFASMIKDAFFHTYTHRSGASVQMNAAI